LDAGSDPSGSREDISMSPVLQGFMFVGGGVLFAVLGVLGGRRLVHHQVAEGHNDVLVPVFLTAGVIYAVLLGFMVVAVWEAYDAAHANVAEEAALLVPLYRQSEALPAEQADALRKALHEYAEQVVSGWDRFVHGRRNVEAGAAMQNLFTTFGALKPVTKAQELTAAQFMTSLNLMLLDRNKRYMHAAESLSWIMWLAAVGGGVVTVALTFLIFMERTWPHVLAVSIMAAMIALLLFTIAVLSRPFLGPLAIEAAPFETSLAVFNDIDHGH
jgi:multisubunit Na+/H+ antiporter MnhC subunit